MHPIRKQKLLLILAVGFVLALAIGLILYALRTNISLFYTPAQVVAGATKPDQVFRIGGLVKRGSLQHQAGLMIEFVLTDLHQQIPVQYTGLLPDLFREGQGIVAQGRLSPTGVFIAQEILAKHDENYHPPVNNESKEK